MQKIVCKITLMLCLFFYIGPPGTSKCRSAHFSNSKTG